MSEENPQEEETDPNMSRMSHGSVPLDVSINPDTSLSPRQLNGMNTDGDCKLQQVDYFCVPSVNEDNQNQLVRVSVSNSQSDYRE